MKNENEKIATTIAPNSSTNNESEPINPDFLYTTVRIINIFICLSFCRDPHMYCLFVHEGRHGGLKRVNCVCNTYTFIC